MFTLKYMYLVYMHVPIFSALLCPAVFMFLLLNIFVLLLNYKMQNLVFSVVGFQIQTTTKMSSLQMMLRLISLFMKFGQQTIRLVSLRSPKSYLKRYMLFYYACCREIIHFHKFPFK